MANEILGRAVVIGIGSSPTPIATARTKSLTVSNEAVDVTSDDDAGIQRFLDTPGQIAVEVSVEGLYYGDDLMTLALSGSPVEDIQFDYGTYTIDGTFFMSSYSESMAYNEATTFSATFSSTSAVLATPVTPP